MSIQTQIDRITNNIADAYTAIEEKGGSVPEEANCDNLAEAIRSIESGGGLPDNIHTISITVNDEDAGTVTGDGAASDGMYVKIEAHPIFANNFCFSHWSENGVEVSRANPYYFTVTKNRNLVANFTQMYDMPQNWFLSDITQTNGSAVPNNTITATQLEYNIYDGYFYFNSYNKRILKTKNFKKVNQSTTSILSPFYDLTGNFSIDDNGILFGIYDNSIVTYDPFTHNSSYLTSASDKLPNYSTYTWCNAIHAKGLYVISANNANSIAYSVDGKEWTVVNGAVYSSGVDLKFIGGKFISWSGYRYSWSDDGINWIISGYSAGGSAHTPSGMFWDGKNIIVVCAKHIDVIPNADFSNFKKGGDISISGALVNNLYGGFYGAGWYVFFRPTTNNSYPKFLYGKTPDNLTESEQVPLDTENYLSSTSSMVGCYGDGKMIVLANGLNKFIYSRPEGPGL